MVPDDGILRLTDDLRVLTAAWERAPLVSAPYDDFADVFSVSYTHRQGEQVPSERAARGRETGGRNRERIVDGAKAVRQVAGGATLVVEDLQTYSAEVAAFAAAVARDTGYETDCTVFLTPGGARGVARHADPVSVFLRQLSGAKRWRVSTPDGRRLLVDVVLKEGECLYIPRGFLHAGAAADEGSVHLSVSVRTVTWGTVLRSLLTEAVEGPALDEPLPPAFAEVDRAEMFRERIALLTEVLGGLRWSDVRPASFRTADIPAPRVPGVLAAALAGPG